MLKLPRRSIDIDDRHFQIQVERAGQCGFKIKAFEQKGEGLVSVSPGITVLIDEETVTDLVFDPIHSLEEIVEHMFALVEHGLRDSVQR